MILGFYELTELPLSKERGNGPTLTEEEISIELCFPGFLNSYIKEPALSSPKISTPTPPPWEVHNIPSQNTHSGGVGRHTPMAHTALLDGSSHSPVWGWQRRALWAVATWDSMLVAVRGRLRQ